MSTPRDQVKARFEAKGGNKFGASVSANPPRSNDQGARALAEVAAAAANDPSRDVDRFKDQDVKAREIIRDQASPSLRRPDFKGKRKQAAFRLRESTMRSVKLVLELKRGEGNDFFEAALDAAAEAELARLKSAVDPAVFDQAASFVEAQLKR